MLKGLNNHRRNQFQMNLSLKKHPCRKNEDPTCLSARKPKHKTQQYCNEFNKDYKNGPHQKKLKKKKELII